MCFYCAVYMYKYVFTCMYLHLSVLCSMLPFPFCVKSTGRANNNKNYKITQLFKFRKLIFSNNRSKLLHTRYSLTCSLSFHLLPSRLHSLLSDLQSFEVATIGFFRKKKHVSHTVIYLFDNTQLELIFHALTFFTTLLFL